MNKNIVLLNLILLILPMTFIKGQEKKQASLPDFFNGEAWKSLSSSVIEYLNYKDELINIRYYYEKPCSLKVEISKISDENYLFREYYKNGSLKCKGIIKTTDSISFEKEVGITNILDSFEEKFHKERYYKVKKVGEWEFINELYDLSTGSFINNKKEGVWYNYIHIGAGQRLPISKKNYKAGICIDSLSFNKLDIKNNLSVEDSLIQKWAIMYCSDSEDRLVFSNLLLGLHDDYIEILPEGKVSTHVVDNSYKIIKKVIAGSWNINEGNIYFRSKKESSKTYNIILLDNYLIFNR